MIERSINFGSNKGLIGTICTPLLSDQVASRVGLVLFNAGVIHRIGPHRINVRLARALAKQGVPSIRFDLSGLGDSTRPDGRQSFEVQAVLDVRAAIDALAFVTGLKKFVLFGFCSGAYYSYNVALADDRVAGLLLFDAYQYPTFRLRLNYFKMQMKQYGVSRAIAHKVGRLFAAGVGYVSTKMGPTPEAKKLRNAVFITRLPSKSDFASGIRTLLNRGVKIAMLQAGEGSYRYNYSRQFDDAFKGYGIADCVSSHFFPNMDHGVTSSAQQANLLEYIDNWFVRLNGDAATVTRADQEVAVGDEKVLMGEHQNPTGW
jgi:pimeloyl-ACP methyl ester carboxylesterase